MRLFSMLLLAIIGLVGCQSSDDEPDPGKSPGEKAAVTLPLHSYDQFDVDATTVQVGREVVLDTDGYEYNKGLDYRWVAWTGESRGERIWNSRALGDVDITQTRFSFKPKFPGLYRISWCPVISENPCVLFGELEVTGEVPVNQVPEVEFYYDNSDLVRQLCSENCKHLIDTGTAIKLNPEITDDDNVHSFNWEGNLVGVNEKVIDQNGLTADGLVFTPTEEGSYRFSMETFDEHITIDGPQKASSQWHFVARNLDNGLPEPQFFVQGFPNARASMVFQYDEAQRRYFPVINYYYEKSFTIEDCAQFPSRGGNLSTIANNYGILLNVIDKEAVLATKARLRSGSILMCGNGLNIGGQVTAKSNGCAAGFGIGHGSNSSGAGHFSNGGASNIVGGGSAYDNLFLPGFAGSGGGTNNGKGGTNGGGVIHLDAGSGVLSLSPFDAFLDASSEGTDNGGGGSGGSILIQTRDIIGQSGTITVDGGDVTNFKGFSNSHGHTGNEVFRHVLKRKTNGQPDDTCACK